MPLVGNPSLCTEYADAYGEGLNMQEYMYASLLRRDTVLHCITKVEAADQQLTTTVTVHVCASETSVEL